MNYLLHILTLLGVYALSCQGLQFLVLYGGVVSLAQAGVMGVGAYATAILIVDFNVGSGLAVLGGIVAGAIVSTLVGVPSLRLGADYLVLSTLAFQLTLFSLLNNWVAVTRGPMGIAGIPDFGVSNLIADNAWKSLGVTWCLVGLGLLLSRRLLDSPFGRCLQAYRGNPTLAAVLGKASGSIRLQMFALAGCYAGAAGGLYATHISYIDPSSFSLMESVFLLACVIVGGRRAGLGPIVGVGLLVICTEALRFLPVPNDLAASLRQLLYAMLLVSFAIFWPAGLLPRQVGKVRRFFGHGESCDGSRASRIAD